METTTNQTLNTGNYTNVNRIEPNLINTGHPEEHNLYIEPCWQQSDALTQIYITWTDMDDA
jgi:hypothetical protein